MIYVAFNTKGYLSKHEHFKLYIYNMLTYVEPFIIKGTMK